MGPAFVTVIDFSTQKITAQWPIPGGGSPDMGNLSVDGKTLWSPIKLAFSQPDIAVRL